MSSPLDPAQDASSPPIQTTTNTLDTSPSKSAPSTTPAGARAASPVTGHDAHAPPPPPATGTGMGLPLDIPAVIDSAAHVVTSVLPTSVSSAFGLGAPASPEAVAMAAASHEVGPSLPPRPEDDPKISALRAMFSDFDVAILQTVLDSVKGNQDRAIDVLLGMNDPSYVSERSTQDDHTDLDEELARRLVVEDENARAFAAEQRLQANGGRAFRPDPYVTSAERSINAAYGTSSTSTDDAPPIPTMRESLADVQQQITKAAEVGRKTFSSLFSKVKDKIAEFEHQQTAGFAKYNQDPNHPYHRPPDAVPQEKPATVAQPTRTLGPSSYFDPALPGPSGTVHQGNTPQIPLGSPGYANYGQASSPPALSTVSESRSATSGPPTPGSIDPGKIGMLPKRPVSLVRDTSGALLTAAPETTQTPARKPEDDEDLGYL